MANRTTPAAAHKQEPTLPQGFFKPQQIGAFFIDRAISLAKQVEPDPRKAKVYAMDAILTLCPDVQADRIARRLSFRYPNTVTKAIARSSQSLWWQNAGTDHVIGGLILREIKGGAR